MYDFNELVGSIKLSQGAHESPEQGMCAMELVSWLEGLPFSDAPECTCPVIAAYVRVVNDKMNQTGRDKLLCYLPKIVGTVSKDHELERAEFFAWQAIREFAPNALSAAGLHEHAKALGAANTFGKARASAYAATEAAYAYAAANAAAAAADARASHDYTPIFTCLEGALAIGPQSPWFSRDVTHALDDAKKLIAA